MLNAGELIVLLIKVFHFFVLRTHLTGMHRYFFFVTTILRNFTSLFYFEEHHLSLASVIIDIPLEALHFEELYLAGVLLNDTSNTSELARTRNPLSESDFISILLTSSYLSFHRCCLHRPLPFAGEFSYRKRDNKLISSSQSPSGCLGGRGAPSPLVLDLSNTLCAHTTCMIRDF